MGRECLGLLFANLYFDDLLLDWSYEYHVIIT